MDNMYRIARSTMLLLVRLVIVVSLAGYTLSNANAAMHGSAFPEIEKTISTGTPLVGDHDAAQPSNHGHQHSASADSDGDDNEDGGKLVKQECCKDFCVGFGLICDSHSVSGPVVTSIRRFVDDQRTFGELPSLHRPPNI